MGERRRKKGDLGTDPRELPEVGGKGKRTQGQKQMKIGQENGDCNKS